MIKKNIVGCVLVSILLLPAVLCVEKTTLKNYTQYDINTNASLDRLITDIKNNKIDLNFQNKDGTTILMVALQKKNTNLINAILAKKPNTFLSDDQGHDALMYAVENNLPQYFANIIAGWQQHKKSIPPKKSTQSTYQKTINLCKMAAQLVLAKFYQSRLYQTVTNPIYHYLGLIYPWVKPSNQVTIKNNNLCDKTQNTKVNRLIEQIKNNTIKVNENIQKTVISLLNNHQNIEYPIATLLQEIVSLNRKLTTADIKYIELLLEQGLGSPNEKVVPQKTITGELPESVLGYATRKGFNTIVALLLKYGAPIDSITETYTNIPGVAAQAARELVTQKSTYQTGQNLIKDIGSDIAQTALAFSQDMITKMTGIHYEALVPGMTPLIEAVITNNNIVVELLITAGANINHTDSNNRTALMYAIGRKNKNAITILLKKLPEVDLHTTDIEGLMAPGMMVANNLTTELQTIITNEDANTNNNYFNPNLIDGWGKTVLYYLIDNTNPNDQKSIKQTLEMLTTLQKKGAKAYIYDSSKAQPILYYAILKKLPITILTQLILMGANVNAPYNTQSKDQFKQLPGGASMMTIAIVAHTDNTYINDVCSLLLTKGTNPNAGDNTGTTPLMYAVQHFPVNTHLVQTILDYKGNPNQLNGDQKSALTLAIKNFEYPTAEGFGEHLVIGVAKGLNTIGKGIQSVKNWWKGSKTPETEAIWPGDDALIKGYKDIVILLMQYGAQKPDNIDDFLNQSTKNNNFTEAQKTDLTALLDTKQLNPIPSTTAPTAPNP